ncbi:hypothetical protein LX32DRAFT_278141 [Colletotrichum zoysiae]|uniref:Secreted protein n=1 Tax=Colletotrichum zoysiae TaxID=1216348 RepID=A0AAD9H294_9PEZI|nr:hypothetical protein LX32DRAFT_278141 [Colletotrichum zoysiae]
MSPSHARGLLTDLCCLSLSAWARPSQAAQCYPQAQTDSHECIEKAREVIVRYGTQRNATQRNATERGAGRWRPTLAPAQLSLYVES